MKFNFFLKWYFPAIIAMLAMIISTCLSDTEYYGILPTDTTYAFFLPALLGVFTLIFADTIFMRTWYVFASAYIIILLPVIFSLPRSTSLIGIESQSTLALVLGVFSAVLTVTSIVIYKIKRRIIKKV